MCLIFLFLNLADVAITISIFLRADFKSLKVLLLSITSLAPTEVAKILSFEYEVYKLTHKIVNQRFFPKLANTPDKMRVSLDDNSIL